MRAKQEYDFGVTKEFLRANYTYDKGELRNHKGKIIGYVDKSTGYKRTEIDGIAWLVSRLVWVYHNGKIDYPLTVDHINHNKLDNHIENLRLATRSQQNKYQRKRRGCSSNYIGVHWRDRDSRYEVYVNLYDSGEKLSKFIGSFRVELEAAKARDKFIVENELTEWNLLNFPTGVNWRDYE